MNGQKQLNHDAFVEYLKAHQSELYRLAYRFTRSRDDTLSILQDAVYHGLSRLQKKKATGDVGLFIRRTLIRECEFYLYRHPVPRPDEEGTATEKAIESMRIGDRTPLILHLYGECDAAQIGLLTGEKTEQAEKRLASAMKRLNSRLPESLRQTRAVPLPEDFDIAVNKALSFPVVAPKKVSIFFYLFLAVVLIFVHTVLLNTVEPYADFSAKVPLFGHLSSALTFRDYDGHRQIGSILDVTSLPIDPDAGTPLERQGKQLVSDRLHSLTEEARLRAEEHYNVWLEEGDDPDAFRPMRVDLRYEITYIGEDAISFHITERENSVYFFEDRFYYNYSIPDGRPLLLSDFLSDPAEQGANAIRNSLPGLSGTVREAIAGVDLSSVIHDQTAFYLDASGEPVLVFPPYSLSDRVSETLAFPLGKQAAPASETP